MRLLLLWYEPSQVSIICYRCSIMSRFFSLLLLEYLSVFCGIWESFSLQVFSYCFPALRSFTLCIQNLVFNNRLSWFPCSLLKIFFCVAPSALVLCYENSSHFSLPSIQWDICAPSPYFIFCRVPPSKKKLGNHRAFLICFPFLRGQRFVMLIDQILKTVVSYILSILLIFLMAGGQVQY